MRPVRALAVLPLLFASIASGCSSRSLGGEPCGAGECDMADAGPRYGDTSPVGHCGSACGSAELCGAMADGDGNDDDCDGAVDESCACPATGVTRACFLGPPDRRGVGACADGVMTCTEFLSWSACVGGQFPRDEACDGSDNDCDGAVDDGIGGCSPLLACPDAETAAPLARHALRGSEIYAGAARSWHWSVACPDTVPACPAPDDPSAQDTSIYFVASGSYRVGLDIVADDGSPVGCEWIVRVRGSGLRVELTWDTNDDTDVDLHLHRRSGAEESPFFSDDDCYFSNCKATGYDPALRARWSMPDTEDLSACRDAPQGQGAAWTGIGACYNPRLDVDVTGCDRAVTDPASYGYCAPENINVDQPPLGEPFRVMVNYWTSHGHAGATHPTVAIYCGGELRASLGADLVHGEGTGRANDSWLVADVAFYENDCGEIECRVAPIGVIVTGAVFGPAWSF